MLARQTLYQLSYRCRFLFPFKNRVSEGSLVGLELQILLCEHKECPHTGGNASLNWSVGRERASLGFTPGNLRMAMFSPFKPMMY